MRKRILAALLSICMLFALAPSGVRAEEQEPYEIGTPEQLMAFAEWVNGGNTGADAVLTADIDMSGQIWTGISVNSGYTGTFDGQGYTISNLTGTEGLFVNVNNAGTVQNVRLENVTIEREGGNQGAAAGVNKGTVFNCVSSGSITGTGQNAWSIGGLVGHNDGGTLSGSSSSCAVSGITAGGLVGSNHNQSYNYGKVIACIYTGNAGRPVEGDHSYGDKTDVYYRDQSGQWKSYPGNSEMEESEVLQKVNDYITKNGGAFNFGEGGAAYPAGAAMYLDYTEDGFVTRYVKDYTSISGDTPPTAWKTGWYVAEGSATINNRVTVSGDVHLILKDGANLTVNGGISVNDGNSFTVYAQSTDESTMGSLTASGGGQQAGIGGDVRSSNGKIAIFGGNITAEGGSGSGWDAGGGAGIGSGYGADSSDGSKILIAGGHVTATGGTGDFGAGAGIGAGGSSSHAKNITITGGVIHATAGQNGAAGIGGGGHDGTLTGLSITGGWIVATGYDKYGSGSNRIAIGGGAGTDSPADLSGCTGVIIDGATGEGQVYGNVTLTENVTLPEKYTLTIPDGSTLNVSGGATITNYGTVKVEKGGTYSGSQPEGNEATYQIDWDTDGDGMVDDTTYVAYGETPTHADGSKTQTGQYIYTFKGWDRQITAVTGTATYTAQFTKTLQSYQVALKGGTGYTFSYNGGATVKYGTEITFGVSLDAGYSKTEDFKVLANGTELTDQGDGSYKVTVQGDTDITVEGVKDITAPSGITVSYSENSFKEFLNNAAFGLFFKDTVTVTISAADEGSGVKKISYQLDDGELQRVAAQNGKITFTVEPEFIGNIKNVTATDNDGNTSAGIDYEYFAVEKQPPAAAAVNTNNYESGTWTAENVTITVSGSSSTSGIAKYQYSTDGGQNWHDMAAAEKTTATAQAPLNVTKAQLTVSDNGTSEYMFRAVSNAENVSENSDAVTVKIDKTEPDIGVTGDTENYRQNDSVKITATAGVSGIAKVEVQKDSGSWEDITNIYLTGYSITENGSYTFRVTNGAGVTASDSITYDKIDAAKPVVVIDSKNYTSGAWTDQDVTLSVSNTANNLGPTTFQYKADGEWQSYTGPITVSAETSGTTYTFKAVSASGVASDEESLIIRIDKTAPDGDIKIEENSVKKLISEVTFGLFFNKDIDVDITGADTLSGVAKTEYYRSEETLDEAGVKAIDEWTAYEEGFSVTAEDEEKFIYYVKITDNAGNVTCFGSDGAAFDLTEPVISGITAGAVYYTTQSVTVSDANLESVALNGETVGKTFTLDGNKDTVYTITATDKAGNVTSCTVTMKPIATLAETIEDITTGNVTSADKADIEAVKASVEAVDDEYAADAEKAALQEILDKCDRLAGKIEETAKAAADLEEALQSYDPSTITSGDKGAVEDLKEDLLNLINSGNLTDAEKEALEEKLEEINNALESIEKTQAVQDAIAALPDTAEPDDTNAQALIEAAKKQYDALTEHEKSLIFEELKEKLENLLGDLLDYRIIEGDGSKWTVGEDGSITITANGSIEKFTGIKVDGKYVDPANYTVKSGSTIITLKPEYLNTLSAGKHTLTVIYTDGETSGEFELLNKAAGETSGEFENLNKDDTTVPETGDSSNILLWAALLLLSSGMLITAVHRKKER